MRTTGYIQFVVSERRYDDSAYRLTVARATSRRPTSPIPGAIVARIVFDVPDSVVNLAGEAAVEAADAEIIAAFSVPVVDEVEANA